MVYVRVGEHDGAVYLDLCNDAWEAVEIASDGWRVVSEPPVRFRRAKGMESLPRPVKGGDLADFTRFANTGSEDDFIRCFNGNDHGTGAPLWENDFGLGYVYDQKGLQIIPDRNGDGFQDLVVGTAGGQRVIRTLSGKTGEILWTHDTAECW